VRGSVQGRRDYTTVEGLVFLGPSGRWGDRGQQMGAAAFTVGIKPR
jgi:hypothetical protein